MTQNREDLDLPELTIGQVVRVFRTHSSGSLWLYDPKTQKYADDGMIREAFAVGKVRERRGDCYRVTVLRRGREYYLDWMSRYWVRLSHEPAPEVPSW